MTAVDCMRWRLIAYQLCVKRQWEEWCRRFLVGIEMACSCTLSFGKTRWYEKMARLNTASRFCASNKMLSLGALFGCRVHEHYWQPTYCASELLCSKVHSSVYWFIIDPETVPYNRELAFFRQHRGQPYPRPLNVFQYSRGHPCRLNEQSCSRASKALSLFLLSQLERDSICCERRTMACSLLCLSPWAQVYVCAYV